MFAANVSGWFTSTLAGMNVSSTKFVGPNGIPRALSRIQYRQQMLETVRPSILKMDAFQSAGFGFETLQRQLARVDRQYQPLFFGSRPWHGPASGERRGQENRPTPRTARGGSATLSF